MIYNDVGVYINAMNRRADIENAIGDAGEGVRNLNRGDAEIARDRVEGAAEDVADVADKVVNAPPETNVLAVQTANVLVFLGLAALYMIVPMVFGLSRFWKTVFAGLVFLVYAGSQFGFNYLAVNSINSRRSATDKLADAGKALYPIAFLLIFYVLLSVFPAWTAVFGNTFGLLFVKMMGVNRILNGEGAGKGLLRQDTESEMVGKMFGSSTNFINTVHNPNYQRIDPECYASIIRTMPKAFHTDRKELVDKFSGLMVKRHIFSEGIWLALVGLAFSVSSCMSLVSGMEMV